MVLSTRLSSVALALVLCAVPVTIGAPERTHDPAKLRQKGFMQSYQAHLKNVAKEHQGVTENKSVEKETSDELSGVMLESGEMDIIQKRELERQEDERVVRKLILSSFLERSGEHDPGGGAKHSAKNAGVVGQPLSKSVGGRVHTGSFRMEDKFARVLARTWRTNSGKGMHAAPYSIRSVACGPRLFVGWTAHQTPNRRLPRKGMITELFEVRAGEFEHVSTKPVGVDWCKEVGSITATTQCDFVALLCRSSHPPAKVGAVDLIHNEFLSAKPTAKRGLYNNIAGRQDHMYLVEWQSSSKSGGLRSETLRQLVFSSIPRISISLVNGYSCYKSDLMLSEGEEVEGWGWRCGDGLGGVCGSGGVAIVCEGGAGVEVGN